MTNPEHPQFSDTEIEEHLRLARIALGRTRQLDNLASRLANFDEAAQSDAEPLVKSCVPADWSNPNYKYWIGTDDEGPLGEPLPSQYGYHPIVLALTEHEAAADGDEQ